MVKINRGGEFKVFDRHKRINGGKRRFVADTKRNIICNAVQPTSATAREPIWRSSLKEIV